MYVERHDIALVTATGGGVTAYSPVVSGRLINIIYTKHGSVAFASTADLTITAEGSAQNLWTEANVNASKTVSPTQAGTTASGATATAAVREPVFLARDRVKVVVAQGGNTKQGTITVVVA